MSEKHYGFVGSTPIPDRLCVETASKFYNKDLLPKIGVAINGVPRNDIVEYCISGKWARIVIRENGKTVRNNCLGTAPRVKRIHGTITVKLL